MHTFLRAWLLLEVLEIRTQRYFDFAQFHAILAHSATTVLPHLQNGEQNTNLVFQWGQHVQSHTEQWTRAMALVRRRTPWILLRGHSRLPLCKTITITSLFCVDNYYIASALGSFCMQLIVLVLLFVRNYYASFSAQWLNFILIWIELQFLYSAHLQLKWIGQLNVLLLLQTS